MKRRSFIQNSCKALGYTTLYSTLFNLKAIGAAAAANSAVGDCDEYKALICFTMNGGNDSFNMLVPYSGDPYTEYAATRGDLAMPTSDLIPITSEIALDRELSVHEALGGMKNIYDSGDCAFIANIGSSVQPIANIDEYYDPNFIKPLGLYSHSDQQKHWQTGTPTQRTGTGWGGKIAEMIDTANCNNTISVNVSLSGTNVFQAGNNSFSYVISPYNGSIGIRNYGGGGTFNNLRDAAMDNMLDHNYQDAFKNAYVDEVKNANDTHILFSSSVDSVTLSNTFGESRLEKSFEMIAKTIRAANGATPLNNMKRQIFYVDLGGFDVHDEVLNTQNELYTEINAALTTFHQEMIDAGLNDNVTTFSMSEFGRTLTSNGQGSDHGWGGNVFLMGGKVNGSSVYGTYPDLATGTSIDLGGGVYIPSTSADEYFAELALWFGVPKTELPILFPNIGNFYDIYSPESPLGLMDLN